MELPKRGGTKNRGDKGPIRNFLLPNETSSFDQQIRLLVNGTSLKPQTNQVITRVLFSPQNDS